MTQLKPVKKKKKPFKTEKNKKNEADQETAPIDKKLEAQINVRNMIMEAHKLHKDHLVRSQRLNLTSNDEIRNKLIEAPRKNSLHSNQSRTAENSNKSSRQVSERSLLPEKIRRRMAEERRKEVINETELEETPAKKRKIPTGQHSSGKLRVQKEMVKNLGPTEFSAGIRVKVNPKRETEKIMKIKDYHVGKFVSLELLDKMKCHESDLYISTKKNNQKSGSENNPEKLHDAVAGATGVIVKKSKKKTKTAESEKEIKGDSPFKKLTEKKIKRKPKKVSSEKYKDVNSELIPISRESPYRKASFKNNETKPESAASNIKSSSSVMDSNLSSIAGAGEPFSSNTSRTYFSSDSDISKIDRKFMQILEAVTQNNIKIEFDKVQHQTVNEAPSRVELTPADIDKQVEELQVDETKNLEMKILERINSLEKKIENSRSKIENITEENASKNEIVKAPNLSTVEIWVKENRGHSAEPDLSRLETQTEMNNKDELVLKSFSELDKVNGSNVEKICRSFGNIEVNSEGKQQVKQVENSVRAITSVNIVKKVTEGTAEDECSVKETHKDDNGKTSSEGTKENKGKQESEPEKNVLQKPLETWSIIKRLEKAFQTLGLNLDDIENSEDSSEEKKTPTKKQELFGKGKRDGCKSETMKRIIEQNTGSSKKKQRKSTRIQDDIQYGVESNGSGDKNMEYKSVRPSRKMEDLIRVQKEKRVPDRMERASFYASVSHAVPHKLAKNMNVQDSHLSEGEIAEAIKSSRKRSSLKQMLEDRSVMQDPFMEGVVICSDTRRPRRYRKTLDNEHFDDIHVGRHSSKRKSDYSLSASCSFSSLSEDDELKFRKRKKNNFVAKHMRKELDDEVLKIQTSGKGDDVSQVAGESQIKSVSQNAFKEIQKVDKVPQIIVLKPTMMPLQGNKNYEVFKMEKENNEIELKHLRERHKQIISEIKTSLDEIKKQHNLYTKLHKQTKRFNRDYHAKRKLLASYLRDVEESYERRKGRHHARGPSSKHSRALSSDSYYCKRYIKVKDKLSDHDMQMLRLKNNMQTPLRRRDMYRDPGGSRTDDETSLDSNVSSAVLAPTTTEFVSTDSAESLCGLKSTARNNATKECDRKSGSLLCLEWKKSKASHNADISKVPTYLAHLLEKLNKIILSEKNQLEDLVIKASGSSNNSSYSEKTRTTASSNSSGCKQAKNQHKLKEESKKAIATGNKTSSTDTSESATHRQHKCKVHGNKKSPAYDRSIDMDMDAGMSKSGAHIQGDPGGGSFDSMEREEIVISESYPTRHSMDESLITCSHLERRAEEFRYRKGDPSFSSRSELLKCDAEHSCCSKKSKAEEEAYRRKLELEHILRVNEKNLRRNTMFARDTSSHALDYDNHHGKGKHPSLNRQRQSIIIDHNRWEENEESQTVLGHASRHSGFGHRRRKTAHEYLKVDKRLGTSHQSSRKYHDIWKKSGRKHHYEEVPVNYFEISLNTPGCSMSKSKDADCQTDIVDDYDEVDDMYLLEESGSGHSYN